jgi:hypothetical protein
VRVVVEEFLYVFEAKAAGGVAPAAQADVREVRGNTRAVVFHPADVDAEERCDFTRVEEAVSVFGRRWDERYWFVHTGSIPTASQRQ